MGQAAVYQWFRHLKEDQQLLEDDLYKGRQVVACNKETTDCVKRWHTRRPQTND